MSKLVAQHSAVMKPMMKAKKRKSKYNFIKVENKVFQYF